MDKKKKNIFLLLLVLIIVKLFIGIFEDDEFNERYLFIKHKPTFKTYFYSPRGMSDKDSNQMNENEKKEQNMYDEYVSKRLFSFPIFL